jgi:hypothetical protein
MQTQNSKMREGSGGINLIIEKWCVFFFLSLPLPMTYFLFLWYVLHDYVCLISGSTKRKGCQASQSKKRRKESSGSCVKFPTTRCLFLCLIYLFELNFTF